MDKLGHFGDLAEKHGLAVALEFYPVSQCRSLAEALELVQAIYRPGRVGINADLLHLMRSGGTVAELVAAPPEFNLYGQVADGPAECTAATLDEEASQARLLAVEGVFDVAGFVAVLPEHCHISVEIPRNSAITHEDRTLVQAERCTAFAMHSLSQRVAFKLPAIAPVPLRSARGQRLLSWPRLGLRSNHQRWEWFGWVG